MNTHSHAFPLTRVFAVLFAACALLVVPAAAQAIALLPANLAFTSTAPSGVKYGDSVSYTPVASGDSPTAVTYTIDATSSAVCKLTAGVVSVTGAGTCKINADQPADSTYDVGTATQSFSVAKVPLTITASSGSNFFGGVVPAIVAFYSGFVNGDSASKLKTKPTCATSAINVSNPGTYPTSCSKADSTNYTFTYTAGTYVVSKAPLVLVPTATVHLGKLPKKYSFVGAGWQNYDDEVSNDVTGRPSCKVSPKAKHKTGVYKVRCNIGKMKSLNYAVTFATGILIVKK